jgi:K+-transporting ATPase KdpF subunit
LLSLAPWRSRSDCSRWVSSPSWRSTSSCVGSEAPPDREDRMVVVASLAFIPLLAYLVYAIWRPERF